jgi:hypothetical protein
MANTKARHQEILTAAAEAIDRFGGVEAIDALLPDQRKLKLRLLKVEISSKTHCTADTARRNIAKALQRARHPLNDIDQWGGERTPAPGKTTGPDPLPENEKRQPVSTRLAPGYKELAQAIAEYYDLPGWGHTIERALDRWVESDPELKVKLIEIGIIIKKREEK